MFVSYSFSLGSYYGESQKSGMVSVSGDKVWVVGRVTTYIAKNKLAACSDRGLIEQGKGRGRLQPKKIVSDCLRYKNPSAHVMI